jgi:hypothetical protein
MAFDLHVTFAGMCLLVHDRTQLHVLLPPTHEHVAKLFYAQQHVDPTADKKEISEKHPLKNRLLDLRPLGPGSSVPGPVPPTVINLGTVMGLAVERKLFESIDTRPPAPFGQDPLPGLVLARVSLAAGTGIVPLPPGNLGAVWKLKGGYHRLAIKVQWTIPDVTGTEFRLRLKGLNGESDEEVEHKLTPIREGGRDMIHLYVFHSPEDDLPNNLPLPAPTTTLEIGAPASHFISYYSLLDLVPELSSIPAETVLAPLSEGEPLVEEVNAHEHRQAPAPVSDPLAEEMNAYEHRQAPGRAAVAAAGGAGTDLSCAVATAPPKG